jgi:hypothetical protein
MSDNKNLPLILGGAALVLGLGAYFLSRGGDDEPAQKEILVDANLSDE